MMNLDFYNHLQKYFTSDQLKLKEPMKKHTTFEIGGVADYFIIPTTIEQVIKSIQLSKEYDIPYFILGKGSNLLVSDEGYRGMVIQLYKNFSSIKAEGTFIRAQSGSSLSLIADEALGCNLTGFEFAAGIPGTLGGAVTMNAGAYGGEMKDILAEVTAMDQEGNVIVIPKEELDLGYRTSVIQRKGYIVLEAVVELTLGDKIQIEDKMSELSQARQSKQPLEYASAGSTFKRPEGHFAGKLIMDSGLRGYKVGGAQISDKHCGFVINNGNATAADVIALMNDVSSKVNEKFGVTLEPEVRLLGKF